MLPSLGFEIFGKESGNLVSAVIDKVVLSEGTAGM